MGTPIASSSSSNLTLLDEAAASCLQVLICTKRYISVLSFDPHVLINLQTLILHNPWGYKPINTVFMEYLGLLQLATSFSDLVEKVAKPGVKVFGLDLTHLNIACIPRWD